MKELFFKIFELAKSLFSYNRVAYLALIISLIVPIYQFFSSKRNLKIEKCDFCKYENFYSLTFIAINKCQHPISIISVELNNKKIKIENCFDKTFLFGGQYPVMDDVIKDYYFTDTFPVCINGLNAQIVRTYFAINSDFNFDLKKLKVEIKTNRGKIKIKHFTNNNYQY